MILLYLTIKFFQGMFWCFAAMIWLCFALAGAMLVTAFGLAMLSFGDDGQALRAGFRAIRPPAYLRPRRRYIHV